MDRNILIVEDEIIIAENMRLMIGEMEGFRLPKVACSIPEAKQNIEMETPDLILLDIRLGENQNGIEFSDYLIDKKIPFVFVTSHGDSSTLRNAIKKEPMGYIIKPVNRALLLSQLELAFSKIKSNVIYCFRSGHSDLRIPESEIIYLKSDNIYTELHTATDRFVIRKSTKNVLDELKNPLVQVHRSYYVNSDFIIEANENIVLSNGTILPLTRTYKNDVLKIVFGRE